VNNLNVQNLILIDESGVNLAMVRLYARSLKGSSKTSGIGLLIVVIVPPET
jgi:hypothetical protein